MTAPTEADYALVERLFEYEEGMAHSDPAAQIAACAVAELRAEMQAKLDAAEACNTALCTQITVEQGMKEKERKLADALAALASAQQGLLVAYRMRGVPSGRDLDTCHKHHNTLAAHAAARKEG